MYDNLLYQNTASLLSSDILNDSLPGALLFYGQAGSGKLTCALETARILSCTGSKKGHWLCSCRACVQHKALVNTNMVLLGSRDCITEISAAFNTFLAAVQQNASYLTAARYLFLRSIRKLTLRFSPVLWQGDDKLSKIAAVTGDIDEELESLDFPHELPSLDAIEKSGEKLLKLCAKLENDFLYDSVPIAQVRNVSAWAHLQSADGKKTVIIENADRMLEAVRNALLKILEEPPADTVFILTTARRNAIMPTILSRVRTYSFTERSYTEQHEVISRVFHKENFNGTIHDFLLTFLPVPPQKIKEESNFFLQKIAAREIPDSPSIIKNCGNFDPRIMLKMFLSELQTASKKMLSSPQGTKAATELSSVLLSCWQNVTVYNQNINAAFDVLVRDMARINRMYGNVLKWAIT